MSETNTSMEMGHTLLIIAFDEKLTLTRTEIYPRNGNLVATLFYVLNLYSVLETVEQLVNNKSNARKWMPLKHVKGNPYKHQPYVRVSTIVIIRIRNWLLSKM